ncbi:MAG: hypothetical protein IJB91_03610 [Oscillospiraceae bacterium]|nr:hypothetical protein [Oscillospiraceae bacterium]
MEQKTEKKADGRVEVFIPRGAANEETNFIIGINGKKYILPRGKTSLVPPEVKAECERSQKAQAALDARIEYMLEQAAKTRP